MDKDGKNSFTLQFYLDTAGKRIKCLRCTARSKRTGLQCGRPAMKLSKTQKCNFHGGKSTGPRTIEGKARIRKAHLIHGNETVQMRLERKQKNAWFAHIEDVMHVLDMATGGRMRGPKPVGYKPIRTIDEVRRWVIGDLLHSAKGPGRDLS
jgi:hypothetical protein